MNYRFYVAKHKAERSQIIGSIVRPDPADTYDIIDRATGACEFRTDDAHHAEHIALALNIDDLTNASAFFQKRIEELSNQLARLAAILRREGIDTSAVENDANESLPPASPS